MALVLTVTFGVLLVFARFPLPFAGLAGPRLLVQEPYAPLPPAQWILPLHTCRSGLPSLFQAIPGMYLSSRLAVRLHAVYFELSVLGDPFGEGKERGGLVPLWNRTLVVVAHLILCSAYRPLLRFLLVNSFGCDSPQVKQGFG